MKNLKWLYIILILVMTLVVTIAIDKYEPTIPKDENFVRKEEGEGGLISTNNYGEEESQTKPEQAKTQVGEASDTNNTELIDISYGLKDHWYSGIITKIEGETIYFDGNYNDKKYILKVPEGSKFASLRTSEPIQLKDIKLGYYIDTYCYYNDDIFGIASNITGDELKKEILQSMALGEANIAGVVGSPMVKNVNIINSNKAIMTIEVMDAYYEALKNEETFEIDILLNSNTKITSKSGLAHSIETINNAAHDIVTIYLDKSTLNDEYPLATVFDSSDS